MYPASLNRLERVVAPFSNTPNGMLAFMVAGWSSFDSIKCRKLIIDSCSRSSISFGDSWNFPFLAIPCSAMRICSLVFPFSFRFVTTVFGSSPIEVLAFAALFSISSRYRSEVV